MTVYQKITDLIGNTPLLELPAGSTPYAPGARVLGKLEAFNPGGSVKDRIALAMIEDARARGLVKDTTEIIEPTSGNTGIGLALVGAALGLKVTIVMPETMSEERRRTIRAYGANLVITPGAGGMKGAIAKAQELHAANPDSFIPQQFENAANPAVHYRTTGPEIWRDTEGAVDILVGGVGTGGTVSGAGRFLKERKSAVKVIAVEPAASPVLSGGKPGPHKIQGIGPGFEAANFQRQYVDEIVQVEELFMDDAEYAVIAFGGTARTAYEAVREARERGIKVGMLRLITIWPFADKAVFELASRVKGILVVELNYGQIVNEVRRAANGQCPVELCAKYNMQIFEPEEIEEAIDRLAANIGGGN